MSISHPRRLTTLLWSVAFLLIASSARADEPAKASKDSDSAKTHASADEVRQWAKDLDSDIFVTRQDADKKLFDAGKDAIAPLVEASSGKSLEVTSSAIDILRRLSQSGEPSTREAAKAALEKLSKGTNATAAELAKEALTPAPSPNAQPGPGIIGNNIQVGGNIRIVVGGAGNIGGNIQLVPGGAVQVFQIRANANNGNRTVDVDDNGKKVHIHEDQNGIEVRVTEKVNGQDKTDTFKAKNAAELKQKSPEGYKLYDKYGQNQINGGIQVQAGAAGGQIIGGIGGRIAPQPNIRLAPLPGVPLAQGALKPIAPAQSPDKNAAEQIEEARKLIAEATDGLKKSASPQDNESVQKAIDKLDEARQKLDEAHQKLDR